MLAINRSGHTALFEMGESSPVCLVLMVNGVFYWGVRVLPTLQLCSLTGREKGSDLNGINIYVTAG